MTANRQLNLDQGAVTWLNAELVVGPHSVALMR